jgi:hypothetical protein
MSDYESESSEQQRLIDECEDEEIENTPLTIQTSDFYTLNEKVELGEMANMFFSNLGSLLFYVCIAVYLFGDLSIYSAAVSTTLRDVICDRNASLPSNVTVNSTDLCWTGKLMTRFDVYRICLIFFTLILSPFVFFNVQKTKYLQVATIIFRWLAFTVMISIAIHRLYSNPPDNLEFLEYSRPNPPKANFREIPYLIGACIYSFMSQHSLPSLITPIKDKHNIYKILSLDYFLIVILYLLLAITGIFAFSEIRDLYTLNFIPSADQEAIILKIIEYFLTLFPVFTLTTSFPIIGITLRNNLTTLFLDKNQMHSYNWFTRRVLFPLMTVIPPFIITFNTENVLSLVSFTGCYAGAIIQYIVPIALIYNARQICRKTLGTGIVNEFSSTFKSNAWLCLIFFWTCVSLVLVTIDLVKE